MGINGVEAGVRVAVGRGPGVELLPDVDPTAGDALGFEVPEAVTDAARWVASASIAEVGEAGMAARLSVVGVALTSPEPLPADTRAPTTTADSATASMVQASDLRR